VGADAGGVPEAPDGGGDRAGQRRLPCRFQRPGVGGAGGGGAPGWPHTPRPGGGGQAPGRLPRATPSSTPRVCGHKTCRPWPAAPPRSRGACCADATSPRSCPRRCWRWPPTTS
jgi:hypothetical protein